MLWFFLPGFYFRQSWVAPSVGGKNIFFSDTFMQFSGHHQGWCQARQLFRTSVSNIPSSFPFIWLLNYTAFFLSPGKNSRRRIWKNHIREMSWKFKTGFVSCITPLWRAELDRIFCRCGTLCNQLQDMLDKPTVANWLTTTARATRPSKEKSVTVVKTKDWIYFTQHF